MVSGRLPSSTKPGSQSFITRQIDSLRPYCSKIDIHEVVGNKLFKHLKSARYIARVSGNYDIIHVHYGLFAISCLIGKGSTPLVLSLMGSDLFGTANKKGNVTLVTALEAHMTKYLARKCNQVIVKTKEMAEAIPGIETEIVPNGVDIDLFNQKPMQECRKLLGWHSDIFYVLFPGNPARLEKNWDLAAKSVEIAQKLCGKEIILKPLHKVLSNEVPMHINAADLVLMTSFSEGSPNVVKEALACNKCVISVNIGDVAILVGNIDGCSVVEHNAQTIGQEVADKLNSGETTVTGRARLQELSLDLDSVAKKIVGIYENVLS